MPTSGPAAMAVQAGDAGQAFADALPDGILVADPHGRISFANRQLAALSGYDLDELIGLPVDIALRPGRLGGSGQVVAAVRDASEPKQLEQALWHSEQRLRLLVNHLVQLRAQ